MGRLREDLVADILFMHIYIYIYIYICQPNLLSGFDVWGSVQLPRSTRAWIQVISFDVERRSQAQHHGSETGTSMLWISSVEKKVEGLSREASSCHFLWWWKAYNHSRKNKLRMFNMKLEEKKMAKFSSGYLEIKKTRRLEGKKHVRLEIHKL